MSDEHNQSRRDFLRQAGTVAWATPFILTMASSTAHAQASCAPAGTNCGAWNSTLEQCLPLAQAPVVCCGSCERISETDMFCACVA